MYHDASTSYHCHCPNANNASNGSAADDESHEANCSLYKEELENFGFHVRGDAPVIIAHVEINSLADVSRVKSSAEAPANALSSLQLGGIKEGDFIVEIAGMDVKWYSHQQVVRLIQSCGAALELKVITPMDRNYLKVVQGSSLLYLSTHLLHHLQPLSSKGSISTLSAASSSGVSSGSSSPTSTTTKPKLRLKTSAKTRFVGSVSSSSWNPFRRTPSLAKIF